jgi:hypothetical protein
MHLVGIQRLECSLPAASRLHSLTSRHLTERPSQPCAWLLCPRLAWLLGLMPITGLSSYGPASSDNVPNLEPRANVGRQDYGPEAGGTGLEENNLASRASPIF